MYMKGMKWIFMEKFKKLVPEDFGVNHTVYSTAQLKNGFKISNFLVNSRCDFLFSRSEESEDEYLLLNIETLGKVKKSEVELLAEKKRVVIIDNAHMNLIAFNISEDELGVAMFGC